MNKITVVGCGNMGGSIVDAFLKAGHNVYAVDSNYNNVKKHVGAVYKERLEDALNVEFILLNLPSTKVVKNVIEAVKDEIKGKIVVNTTTATPEETVQIAAYCENLGISYIDSKIECYPAEVGTENGVFTYSGNQEVFNSIYDTLKALSPEPLYFGDAIASSAVIDIACINVQYAYYQSFIEGIALSIKYGTDINTLIQMGSIGMPGIIQAAQRELTREFVDKKYTGEFDKALEASIAVDLHGLTNVKDSFRAADLKPILVKSMYNAVNSANDKGLGDRDHLAIINELFSK